MLNLLHILNAHSPHILSYFRLASVLVKNMSNILQGYIKYNTNISSEYICHEFRLYLNSN